MNPWKIIGWIVLAVILLMLGLCTFVLSQVGDTSDSSSPSSPSLSSSSPEQHAAPSYNINVVSVECNDNYGRNRADVTVTNTGNTTIPYAKAFVQFLDGSGKMLSAQDSYFSPTNIPPGATASATVYSNGGGAKSCGLSSVQDGDGNAVRIE